MSPVPVSNSHTVIHIVKRKKGIPTVIGHMVIPPHLAQRMQETKLPRYQLFREKAA